MAEHCDKHDFYFGEDDQSYEANYNCAHFNELAFVEKINKMQAENV